MRTLKRIAADIVKRLKNDIADRAGIGDEWEAIDEQIQEEILETWRAIIHEESASGEPKKRRRPKKTDLLVIDKL